MKTRFPCELVAVLGLVVAVASVGAFAFFDVSELFDAALGLIGIPLAGALLVVLMDLVAECRRARGGGDTRAAARLLRPNTTVTAKRALRLLRMRGRRRAIVTSNQIPLQRCA
jgi:hypothetical protein